MPNGSAASPDDLIPVGVIRGAYGIRGWLKIAPYAHDGDALGATRNWWLLTADSRRQLTVVGLRHRERLWLAQCEGIDSKEAADALKGAEVAVMRGDFPPLGEGEHYLADLLGRRVVNRQGVELGCIVGLRESGPAQWLEVVGGDQAVVLIPLVQQYIDEVDPQAGLVRVDWQEDW